MYLKYKRYHLAFWLYLLTISIERNNEDGGPPYYDHVQFYDGAETFDFPVSLHVSIN
jgi:hypothetical protein